MISVKKFVVNPLQENSFLLYDETGNCLIVDAGFYFREEVDELLEFVGNHKLKPSLLLNTHCHFDHMMGVEFLRNHYSIPFHCHREDAYWLKRASLQSSLFGITMQDVAEADGYVTGGEILSLGSSTLEVIEVPGHSPGHVVLFAREEAFLLAGDVLFYGSIGRTDLPGGNYDQLISGIRSKLLVLPPATKVYCGHGPETTIGFEGSSNPFLI